MGVLPWREGIPRLPGLTAEESLAVQRDAEEGNPVAQYIIGKAHWYGEGLPRDTARGARLLLQAAERGFRPAQMLVKTLGLAEESTPAKIGA